MVHILGNDDIPTMEVGVIEFNEKDQDLVLTCQEFSEDSMLVTPFGSSSNTVIFETRVVQPDAEAQIIIGKEQARMLVEWLSDHFNLSPTK